MANGRDGNRWFAIKPSRRRGAVRSLRGSVEHLEPRTLLSAVPFGAMENDTGEFMLGDVSVTVVLMESNNQLSSRNDNSETWTAAAIQEVKDKIAEGLQWWETTLARITDRHHLDFLLDYTYADNPVTTSYEPIKNRSDAVADWIYDFLDKVGFNATSDFTADIRAFNQSQRERYSTDWAFTIFVVNDQNDLVNDLVGPGHFAPGGSFDRAFAYAGGRFFVTPAGRPASTIAHETGHMFWALDEYVGYSGAAGLNSYTASRGYYNTQNLNAGDNPAFRDPLSGQRQQPSIMASGAVLEQAFAAHTSSTSSLEMIGWRDSDGDGVFDVLDVPLTLTGSGYFDEPRGVYRFVGASAVDTLPNRNLYPPLLPSETLAQNDITINHVSRVEYQIDGAEWQTAAVYDAYTADLDLTIPMPSGATSIALRAVDDVTGVTSPVFAGSTSRATSVDKPGIQGFVWNDADADGIWDATERGLAGATIQLVDEQGRPLALAQVIEPDDYSDRTKRLDDVVPGAHLSAVGSGVSGPGIFSDAAGSGAGNRVFASSSSSQWARDTKRLRMDFATAVSTVRLGAVGNSAEDYARLEVYDSQNRLLDRYTTGPLASGVRETMVVERPTADIAYAIAFGHAGSTVLLDRLQFGPETAAVTDAMGAYSLTGLAPGAYNVQVVPGLDQVLPTEGAATYPVSLSAGQAVTGIDFGLHFTGGVWQNAENRFDVNADGFVSPIDVLLLVNRLNAFGARKLTESDVGPPFVDVSGDGYLSPIDVLLIVNQINARSWTSSAAGRASGGDGRSSSGSGEGENASVFGQNAASAAPARGLGEGGTGFQPSASSEYRVPASSALEHGNREAGSASRIGSRAWGSSRWAKGPAGRIGELDLEAAIADLAEEVADRWQGSCGL